MSKEILIDPKETNTLFDKRNGFTLMEIIIAIGILSFLIVIFLNILKRNTDTNISLKNYHTIESLKKEISIILESENNCRISLAGDGPKGLPTTPFVFNKIDHDQDGEGIAIILSLSNELGTEASTEKFKADTEYKDIEINSIKLLFKNNPSNNYSENLLQHRDIGELQVALKVKSANQRSNTIKLTFYFEVYLRTTSSGSTTILSCSSIPSPIDYEEFCSFSSRHYDISNPNFCSP